VEETCESDRLCIKYRAPGALVCQLEAVNLYRNGKSMHRRHMRAPARNISGLFSCQAGVQA